MSFYVRASLAVSIVAIVITAAINGLTSWRYRNREFLFEPRLLQAHGPSAEARTVREPVWRPSTRVSAYYGFDIRNDRGIDGLGVRDFSIRAPLITLTVIDVTAISRVFQGAARRKPLRIGVLIDQSGSMVTQFGLVGNDPEGKRFEAAAQLRKLFPLDKMALYGFSDFITKIVGFDATPDEYQQGVLTLRRDTVHSGTNFWPSVQTVIGDGPSDVVFVLTDAVQLPDSGRNAALSLAKQVGTRVEVLHLGSSVNDGLAADAKATGGEYKQVVKAEDLAFGFSSLANRISRRRVVGWHVVTRAERADGKGFGRLLHAYLAAPAVQIDASLIGARLRP